MNLVLVHLFLSVMFFFATNWIGKHSIQVGYMQLSVSSIEADARLFNLAYRAFAPVALMVIVSALLVWTRHHSYIKEIYLVIAYYFGIRIGFNVATQRVALVDWTEMMLISLVSIGLGYFVYANMIVDGEFFFPSRQEIGSAVWLAIAAFAYKTINSVEFSSKAKRKRIERYVEARLDVYRARYGNLIHDLTNVKEEKDLIWAIMIYEGFNRPNIYRAMERLVFPAIKKNATIGPMQVETTKKISDIESVEIGASRVIAGYRDAVIKLDLADGGWALVGARDAVTDSYNRGAGYSHEVENVFQIVSELTSD